MKSMHVLYIEKYKKSYKNNKFNLLQRRLKNLNYVIGHILYQIFKIILSISSKNMKNVTDNTPIRIYVNKIENRIIFNNKKGLISNC